MGKNTSVCIHVGGKGGLEQQRDKGEQQDSAGSAEHKGMRCENCKGPTRSSYQTLFTRKAARQLRNALLPTAPTQRCQGTKQGEQTDGETSHEREVLHPGRVFPPSLSTQVHGHGSLCETAKPEANSACCGYSDAAWGYNSERGVSQ